MNIYENLFALLSLRSFQKDMLYFLFVLLHKILNTLTSYCTRPARNWTASVPYTNAKHLAYEDEETTILDEE